MITNSNTFDFSGNIAIVTNGEPFSVIELLIDGLINIKEKRNLQFIIILVGSDKISTYISARINGFTFVDTYFSGIDHRLYIISKTPFSNKKSHIMCYAEKLTEGKLSILKSESVELIISEYNIKGSPGGIKRISPKECMNRINRELKG